MAYCLMAPSHYQNWWWLNFKAILRHSPDSNFTRKAHDLNLQHAYVTRLHFWNFYHISQQGLHDTFSKWGPETIRDTLKYNYWRYHNIFFSSLPSDLHKMQIISHECKPCLRPKASKLKWQWLNHLTQSLQFTRANWDKWLVVLVSVSLYLNYWAGLFTNSTSIVWYHNNHLWTWSHITYPSNFLNPLRAKFFRVNINIFLHFMSFLHTNKTHVVEIPPRVRQGPAYST